MGAADLNKRITLQAKASGVDATGAPLTGWTPAGQAWASIKDISGRQYVAGKAGQNSVTTTIRIRHRDNVTAQMRVVHGDDVYDIEAVLGNDGRWLELMCAKGGNNG